MRTFFIDKQDIVRITGERFYKRGYDYFKKNRVYGLTYNPSINSWKGTVRGTETYSVRIFFFDHDDIEASCDCPAYATHYTCKHIAAVLLAIGQTSWDKLKKTNNGQTPPPSKEDGYLIDDTFTTRIIDAFSKPSQPVTTKQQVLQMDYIIGTRKNPHNSKAFLEIELKVGANKTYVIRNIREFLVSIKKNQAYKITTNFTYQPDTHAFTEKDQEILQYLLTAYDHEALVEHGLSNPIHDKRTIVIPPGAANQLLSLISEQSCFYKEGDGSYHNGITIKDQLDELTFSLMKQDQNTYQVDISALANYTYLENYHYLLKQGTFYRLTNEQHQIIDQIFTVLPYRTKQTHPISAENIEAFLTKVVPQLEQIGNVNYGKDTKDWIKLAPLSSIIYLDETDGTLTADVAFHYGDAVIYPYNDDIPKGVVVKRDIAKEMNVLRLLEDAGFVFLNNRFQLFKNEAIYKFLHEQLSELKEIATVHTSVHVDAMIIDKPTFKTEVDLDSKKGFLDIFFDLEGISKEDVQHVLQAIIDKKSFVRIHDGGLLALDQDEFKPFRSLADQLQLNKKQVEDGHVQLPAARSFQVEETLKRQSSNYGQAYEQLLSDLKQPDSLNFPLPKDLNAELRDYQHTGFQWLKTLSTYHLGGILADDMGLGKTLQTISYLLSEKESSTDGHQSLVVAPASLVYNWKKEFEKFAPTMKTVVISGNKAQRQKRIENERADVYITSYPLIRKDVQLYEQQLFDSLILDEAQAIKNHLTLTAKSIRSIQARQRFALSGTPIENALEELWSIFHTISPGMFGNKKTFLKLERETIIKMTRPFLLRRVKKDVLHELPDKIETVNYSDLTKNQKEVYVAHVEKMRQTMNQTIEEKGFERGKLEILAGLTRLRQICCHPSLFMENYSGKSGKLEQLMELVDELIANGKRPLIFSQFASMLSIINDKLNQTGFDTFYLDGSTPSKERIEMVDAFNDGEKPIFLISLKAGGTGLNLTGADTVILFDLWWNPAVEEQAAGRAHRIGQKNVVQVIRLITEGTIEEKIYEMQQKKRALVDQIIQPGETMLSKLSEQELRELLEVK
ncbi:SNF2 helicase associated domain-containing protein [Aquibacillus albus]|nr:SNF2 helicase associated domain-containing protein [Aquibacillus albus]